MKQRFDDKRRLHCLPALGLTFSAALLAAAAHAEPNAPRTPDGWSGSAGLGVARSATYEGSPNHTGSVIPLFTLAYRDPRLGTFELGGLGLAWRFVETDDYRLGVYLGGDGGRKSTGKRSGGLFRSGGDDRLAGMGDIASTSELGITAGWGPFTLNAHKALGNKGHGGMQIDLAASLPIYSSERLDIDAGPGLTWADGKYMQAYFGVTQAQAAASRFTAYTPKAGLRKLDLNLAGHYKLDKAWSVAAGVTVSQLLGDARKSPLAEKKTDTTVFAAVVYGF